MNEGQPPKDKLGIYEHEIAQADELLKKLEPIAGAQKLGDDAYETAKQNLAEKGLKP